MNKLRRGGFCSDIHFGRKASSQQHNQDCLNYIDWFCNRVQENNCQYVAFLGDWFESRSSVNIHTLHYSYKAAKKLNELGLPIFFVVGNHDLYYRNSREVYSVIHHNEFNNFTVIDKPLVVDNIEGKVLFCPYLFHEEYPSLAKYLTIPFWAGHFEFRGFIVTGYNVTMPTGPEAMDFRGPRYIVSGHFHKRQTKPGTNIVYIGNTFPLDFSDAGDFERGMMIYDHLDNDMWFENWEECPKYIKTKLSTLVDTDKKNREKILLPSSKISCLVDFSIDFDESKYLKEKFIEDYSLREFTFEESPEVRGALADTETDIDWNNENLQTVDELVLLMLNHINTDHIDNNLLVDLYKDIKPTEC